MKNVFKNPKINMVIVLLALTVTAAAWQRIDKNTRDTSGKKYESGDTSRPGKPATDKDAGRIKDFDEAMRQLDIEMKNLDLQMKDIDIKLTKELNEAFSSVDFEKIRKEVSAELKKVDFEKMNAEVTQALREAEQEINKIDQEKLRKEMDELRVDLNSGKLKAEIENAMKEAKKDMEKAKKELQLLKDFTDALQKDGLIDKAEPYTIEWKNGGQLYINGTKQPASVSEKYRKYYKGNDYKIKMNGEDNFDLDFNIDFDNEGTVI